MNLLINSSCTHEPQIFDQIDTICFDSQILPLIQNSCGTANCHDGSTKAGDFDASNYETILQVVKPGYPKESMLYNVLTSIWGDNIMPPDNPLSISDRNLIQLWIAQGALNNNCAQSNCDTLSDISFSNQVFPVIENNCLSCHNASISRGGISLDNYQNISSVIETERNNTSLLVGVINRISGFDPMPPNNSMDPCYIRFIELWIVQGYENN